MVKRKIIYSKRRMLLRGVNLNPRVVLNRLTEEDIARYTINVRNQYNHSSRYVNEIYIKEEPVDENQFYTEFIQIEEYRNVQSSIKIEPVDLDTVITEHMYENTYESSTITNYYGTFNCNMCYEVFNNYEELIVHKHLTHKDKLHYSCQFCDEKFYLSAHLNSHLLVHVNHLRRNNTPLALPQVTTQSSSENDSTISQKTKYIRKVTNKEPQCTTQFNCFKCPNCSFVTDSKPKLSRHQNSCYKKQHFNSNNSFKCELCLKSFVNQHSLNGHKRYHSLRGDMISIRALRKKGIYIRPVKRPVEPVEPKPKDKAKIACKVCNKQFVLTKRLERHMLLHKSLKTNSKENSLEKSKKRKNVSGTFKFKVKFGFPNAMNKGTNRQ